MGAFQGVRPPPSYAGAASVASSFLEAGDSFVKSLLEKDWTTPFQLSFIPIAPIATTAAFIATAQLAPPVARLTITDMPVTMATMAGDFHLEVPSFSSIFVKTGTKRKTTLRIKKRQRNTSITHLLVELS